MHSDTTVRIEKGRWGTSPEKDESLVISFPRRKHLRRETSCLTRTHRPNSLDSPGTSENQICVSDGTPPEESCVLNSFERYRPFGSRNEAPVHKNPTTRQDCCLPPPPDGVEAQRNHVSRPGARERWPSHQRHELARLQWQPLDPSVVAGVHVGFMAHRSLPRNGRRDTRPSPCSNPGFERRGPTSPGPGGCRMGHGPGGELSQEIMPVVGCPLTRPRSTTRRRIARARHYRSVASSGHQPDFGTLRPGQMDIRTGVIARSTSDGKELPLVGYSL